eukprot:TRINITY_DN3388_c0_g1_i3.p2 TRINITY_DN3388_c0_g1~~TRINITY_DN3388_c0_g1_i3.p2  ORF type:complete len:202 (+),score=-12.09 TRINITY_DN3388_c0_g1_i3:621-1226(+)
MASQISVKIQAVCWCKWPFEKYKQPVISHSRYERNLYIYIGIDYSHQFKPKKKTKQNKICLLYVLFAIIFDKQIRINMKLYLLFKIKKNKVFTVKNTINISKSQQHGQDGLSKTTQAKFPPNHKIYQQVLNYQVLYQVQFVESSSNTNQPQIQSKHTLNILYSSSLYRSQSNIGYTYILCESYTHNHLVAIYVQSFIKCAH